MRVPLRLMFPLIGQSLAPLAAAASSRSPRGQHDGPTK